MDPTSKGLLHFGEFELDLDREKLRRNEKTIKLQPQPFKVLALLVSQAGRQVSRDEIRRHVWTEGTYVDFDQGVNFCVRQIREALRDDAERPVYIETIPRRGYRFMVPVTVHEPGQEKVRGHGATTRLQKILWANVADLRMEEARRRRSTTIGLAIVIILLAIVLVLLIVR